MIKDKQEEPLCKPCGKICLIPGELSPFWIEIKIDLVALGFTLAVSLLTGVVFGLWPAWRAVNLNLNESLKDGNPTAGARSPQARELLVIAEIALSMVLLVGAGLMIKSLARLQGVRATRSRGNHCEGRCVPQLHPLFHQRFPTGTCAVSNDGV